MRERCAELDARDPLAPLRDEFDLPEGVVYLDGNSLGALPHRVRHRLRAVVDDEWGRSLVAAWNDHAWMDLPRTVGERIAPLVGAAPGQVLCTDSVSVDLHKLLAAALALRPGRTVILTQEGNFPTDVYVAQGLAALLGPDRCELRRAGPTQLETALDADVAVLLWTQVDYRTGELHDVEAMTTLAAERGALTLWDLSHSTGVVPVRLDAWGVDLAVGCGYKFLNGGPGAPAFVYVADRHQEVARQPITGWMGHARPFDFSPEYEPARGVGRFAAGTPGILGMRALEAALGLFERCGIEELRRKSLALTGLFIDMIDARDSLRAMELRTPRSPGARGSQVSLAHPEAGAISQALIESGVMVDFRPPDVVRFGFSPMYNRYADVAAAVEALEDVLTSGRFREPRFRHAPCI